MTKEEIKNIIYDCLIKCDPTIKNFSVNKTIKHRKDKFIRAEVAYTWNLNGWEKPVITDIMLAMVNGVWKKIY